MARDSQRIGRIQQGLEEADLDAVVCSLPTNVLLLSGYWPVVGTSLAVASRDGRVALIVPEDEQELAKRGWADQVRTFPSGSLDELKSASESVRDPLSKVAVMLGIKRGRVLGYENDAVFEPTSYAAMHLYGPAMHDLLGQAIPFVALAPAGGMLARLRSVMTAHETDRVRTACRIAEVAFIEGARKTRAGLRETEVAALFREPLSMNGTEREGVARADGFTYCMSGPNSVEAYASYQRSRARQLTGGDFALVHCNSYADGYWTDVTRTISVGEPDRLKREMYDAVFAARRAAFDAIRPGVKASDVDAAARAVLEQNGFGEYFKHGLGHGVGFAAINHNARPRLHPESDDVLEEGMVFNVEPGIYIDGDGGLRHCDMVAVTETGMEVLTPFQSNIEQLTVRA
jgi:Xaa-Pro aminopeptidase